MPKIHMSFRLEDDLYSRIMEICKEQKLSMTDCLNEFLRKGLFPPEAKDEEVVIEMGNEKEREGYSPEFVRDWVELKVALKELDGLKSKMATVDEFCRKFPDLCSMIDGQGKKIEKLEGALEKAKPQEAAHRTASEWIECEQCGPQFKKYFREKLVSICESDKELCQQIIKTLKEKPELFPDVELREKSKGFL